MNDLEEFENWHKDLMVWEHFQDELERISGENISDNSHELDNENIFVLRNFHATLCKT